MCWRGICLGGFAGGLFSTAVGCSSRSSVAISLRHRACSARAAGAGGQGPTATYYGLSPRRRIPADLEDSGPRGFRQ